MKIPLAHSTLLVIVLTISSLPVSAQTVLSPTPLIPFPDRESRALAATLHNHQSSDKPSVSAEEGNEKTFHIPLVFNDSVESQIEYFTTQGRTVFQNWLDRSARYLPIMKKIFREHNLPEDLVYVAMIESGFNLHAVSPKKAVGPWQFMKATARAYGLTADNWVDERKDPIKSTRAAAAHLKDLYNLFGSWPMALASYNAGMGRMQGAVLKARSDDFWELRASRFIHMETQEYVPRYMAALIIAKNPTDYGFTEPADKPFEYDEIVVNGSTNLQLIARYTGCSYKELRDLNPELLQPATPQSSRYVLRIPSGTKRMYQKQAAKASSRQKKLREEQDQARTGGLLFSMLVSSDPATVPERIIPASVLWRYAAHFSFADYLQMGDQGNRPFRTTDVLDLIGGKGIYR